MRSIASLLSHLALLLLIGYRVPAQVVLPSAPQGQAATGTASLSGRVLVQDKPVVGVQLSLLRGTMGSMPGQTGMRAQSDEEGRYRFSGLVAGSYQINPLSSVYVWGEGRPGESALTITLSDTEQATNVDISLRRGGVITGKVTDHEGHPIVERFVQVDTIGAQPGMPPIGYAMQFMTDDRGVYRYYGVPAGRYRVSCGDGEGSFRQGGIGRSFPRTFHPDVRDEGRATIVEVSAGAEVTGVDIRLSPPIKTLSIMGRLVSETNQPVASINVAGELLRDDGRGVQMRAAAMSGANGEFEFPAVRTGRWRIYAGGNYPSSGVAARSYSDPVEVEVSDGNVTGVELRIKQAGSIAGVAVIEGEVPRSNAPSLEGQPVMISVRGDTDALSYPSLGQGKIGSDGSFRIDGVRPGLATFMTLLRPGQVRLSLIRTERDGQSLAAGVQIGPAENVTGVRLVFAYGTATIHGQVVVNGGALPAGAALFAAARGTNGSAVQGSAEVDSRGNFSIEGLVPGQYEVEVRLIPMQNRLATPGTGVKQTVTVAGGESLKVTLAYTLKAP